MPGCTIYANGVAPPIPIVSRYISTSYNEKRARGVQQFGMESGNRLPLEKKLILEMVGRRGGPQHRYYSMHVDME